MSKKEFLDTLRLTLEGEVEPEIIEQNIRYYDDYINNGSDMSEREVLEALGDPRLIAKTIIDAEKIAKQRSGNVHSQSYSSEESRGYRSNEGYGNESNRGNASRRRRGIYSSMMWYHKVAIIAVLIVLIIILLIIGRVILRFLSVFAIPIILMYLLYSLFRKR